MMPENEKSPLPAAMPGPSAKPSSARASLALLCAVGALAVSGWQWLESRHRLADAEQEISRRLAEADAGKQQEHGAQKQLQVQIEDLQTRLGAFEGKLAEFQTQSQALQTLSLDISRSREEATLLEVEQAITLAGQQLQLAGNVPVALLALQAADARLARLERPQYLPLRKAVAKDLAHLAAQPFVDVPGLSLRLEQVVLAADKLPLASHGRPLDTAAPVAPAADSTWWQRVGGELWQEIKGLVRIQRFDREEPALLAPGQSFMLRENLKLRLLNARLALLSRDPATFRNEVKQVLEWLGRHFDTADKGVQAAQATLGQMNAAALNAELPTLNDSQAAVRALRSGKEKR